MAVDADKNIFSAELSFVPLFNLALQQNALPVIYELKLVNNSGREIENLQCRLSAVPEFIHEKTVSVSKIKDGEELCITKPEIELNYNLLSSLSERMKGKLKLEVCDGFKLIAVYNNNDLVMTFTWQPESLSMDVPVSMTYAGATYYYVTDGNKNVTALLDASGNRVAEYVYAPFGQTVSATGSMAQINPFRFSSEFHDDETGLVYYNYRYYSPELMPEVLKRGKSFI